MNPILQQIHAININSESPLSYHTSCLYPHINDVLMMMMTNRKAALQDMLGCMLPKPAIDGRWLAFSFSRLFLFQSG
jgi:hypothetical protein